MSYHDKDHRRDLPETIAQVPLTERMWWERMDTGVPVDTENPIAWRLAAEIAASPDRRIPFSRVMEESLYSPDGKYTNDLRIGMGVEPDFVTCPEQSELFSASIGRFAGRVWEALGGPETFMVTEPGAGNGTMAHDMLYWLTQLEPEVAEAVLYTIVETSPELVLRQRARLQEYPTVDWIEGSSTEVDLPERSGIDVMNEHIDAFAVERVARLNGELKQKYVTIENGRWVEVWGAVTDAVSEHIAEYGITIQEHVEEPINLQAVTYYDRACQTLTQGAIVNFDYGEDGEVGHENAFAVRPIGKTQEGERLFTDKHTYPGGNPEEFIQLYANLGKLDLTSDVNFSVLRQVAARHGFVQFFEDDQTTFIINNDIIRLMEETAHVSDREKSWRLFERMLHSHGNVMQIVNPGNFHCQILTKDIDHTAIQFPKRRLFDMNTFPTVSFPLGIPDSSVMIRYQGGTQREQPTDAEGRFTEHISLLEDALLVYRDAQNALQIINMKSPVGQKRAASLLGYTYDKE